MTRIESLPVPNLEVIFEAQRRAPNQDNASKFYDLIFQGNAKKNIRELLNFFEDGTFTAEITAKINREPMTRKLAIIKKVVLIGEVLLFKQIVKLNTWNDESLIFFATFARKNKKSDIFQYMLTNRRFLHINEILQDIDNTCILRPAYLRHLFDVTKNDLAKVSIEEVKEEKEEKKE